MFFVTSHPRSVTGVAAIERLWHLYSKSKHTHIIPLYSRQTDIICLSLDEDPATVEGLPTKQVCVCIEVVSIEMRRKKVKKKNASFSRSSSVLEHTEKQPCCVGNFRALAPELYLQGQTASSLRRSVKDNDAARTAGRTDRCSIEVSAGYPHTGIYRKVSIYTTLHVIHVKYIVDMSCSSKHISKKKDLGNQHH